MSERLMSADASSMMAVCDFVRMCGGGMAPGGRLTSAVLAAVALAMDGVGGGEYSLARWLVPTFRSTEGNVCVDPRCELLDDAAMA